MPDNTKAPTQVLLFLETTPTYISSWTKAVTETMKTSHWKIPMYTYRINPYIGKMTQSQFRKLQSAKQFKQLHC